MTESIESDSREMGAALAPQWPRALRYVGLVTLGLAVIAVLAFLQPILAMLVLSFVFAFVLDLPARSISRRLEARRPNSYRLTAIIIYLIIYLILASLLVFGTIYFVDGLKGLISTIEENGSGFISALGGARPAEDTAVSALQSIGGSVASLLPDALQAAFDFAKTILNIPLRLFGGFVTAIVYFGFCIFMSMLILLFLYRVRGALRPWVPARYEREVSLVLERLDVLWVRFLGAEALYAIVLAAVSALEYLILGVPYPIILAVIRAIVSLIPLVGGLIAAVITVIPCLLLGSSTLTEMSPVAFALLILVVDGVTNQVTYNAILLPVLSVVVRIPFWIVLVGVMLGMATDNILLAFLIVPTFGTLILFGRYLAAKVFGRAPFPPEASPPDRPTGVFTQLYIQNADS